MCLSNAPFRSQSHPRPGVIDRRNYHAGRRCCRSRVEQILDNLLCSLTCRCRAISYVWRRSAARAARPAQHRLARVDDVTATYGATSITHWGKGRLTRLQLDGNLNQIQSSRRLERECGRNVELMWLTGQLTPNFKTIADFRNDNGPAIRDVCRRFVTLCRNIQLLDEAKCPRRDRITGLGQIPGGPKNGGRSRLR
jgi:Transposase domain (DUF772)